MQAAWKVGLFVVVFLGLLLGAYAVLQQSVFARKTERYYAVFPDAAGVTNGSAVLLSGVKVGTVSDIRLLRPDQARLTLDLDKGTVVPAGSEASIPASLVGIGDLRVLITAPRQPAPALSPGSTLPGSVASPLASLLPDSGKTLEELNKTLVAVRGLIQDKGLKQDLHGLMGTVKTTAAKFGGLADRVNGLLASNSSQFNHLLTTTSSTLENMQAVSREVRRLVVSGELQGKTTALLDNLTSAVQKGKALVADLQSIVADPEMRASLKDTLSNVKVMSDSGTRIAANAEVMSKNGVEITEETKTLMAKANRLADQVQELIEKFNATVGKLTGPAKSIVSGVEFEGTLAQETKPGRLRTDANVFIPLGKDRLMFGLYDAFETNRLNLQVQRQVSPKLGLRYGSYASKPGLGVDYAVAPRLGLRGDLFGLNDPRFDFRLGYRFAPEFEGWLGVDRLFDVNAPTLGVTIRR